MAASRREQKEQTREQIFATAMRLFDDRGYPDVGVDDIVRASEVARGTFYFHFPTKDDVLLEAIRRGETLILERVSKLPPKAKIRRVLVTTVRGFVEAWGARRDLLPHAGTVALSKIAGVREEQERDPLRLELGRRAQEAQARGELKSPLPGAMLADIFLLNVFAALMAWSKTGQPEVNVLVAGVVELFFGGVQGLKKLRRDA